MHVAFPREMMVAGVPTARPYAGRSTCGSRAIAQRSPRGYVIDAAYGTARRRVVPPTQGLALDVVSRLALVRPALAYAIRS